MCLNPIHVKCQTFACGKCVECRMLKSKEWAFRVCLEASSHTENCVLTLTYNDNNIPVGNTLRKADYQKFLKRLRKRLSAIKVKYFACGEYGSVENTNRPHFHIIIFGWKPPDLEFFCKDKKGTILYRSRIIEKLWPFGFSTVGDVTLDTAKYCAKYMQKKLGQDDERLQPFIAMSKGLGFSAYSFKWLETDKLYVNGKFMRTPRYFEEKAKEYGFEYLVDYCRERRKNADKKPFILDGVFYDELYDNWLLERQEKFKRIFEKTLDNDFNLC